MTKKLAACMGAALVGSLVLAGCGQRGSGGGSGTFDSAPPEIREAWDKAVAADKTNDYVTAVLGYKQILAQQDRLPPNQAKVVQEASGNLFQRLVAASAKGDPAARQALAQLQPAPQRQKRAP